MQILKLIDDKHILVLSGIFQNCFGTVESILKKGFKVVQNKYILRKKTAYKSI